MALDWGAIANTGGWTQRGLMEALSSRIGVSRWIPRPPSILADALENQGDAPDDAVIALAPMDWAAAKSRLAVLKSPTYSAVVPESAAAEGAASRVDLRVVIEKEGLEAAKAVATEAGVATVSRVLRLPAEKCACSPLPKSRRFAHGDRTALSIEIVSDSKCPSRPASDLSVTDWYQSWLAGGPSTGKARLKHPGRWRTRALNATSKPQRRNDASLSSLVEQASQNAENA